MDDAIPVDASLEPYPASIRATADRLRGLVLRAVADAIEAVRPGWRLMGYDVPDGRRARSFAYIAPEPAHVHLGFEHGALLADPDGRLQGASLGLRRVRYLTFAPDVDIADDILLGFIRAAADIALLPVAARAGVALEAAEAGSAAGLWPTIRADLRYPP